MSKAAEHEHHRRSEVVVGGLYRMIYGRSLTADPDGAMDPVIRWGGSLKAGELFTPLEVRVDEDVEESENDNVVWLTVKVCGTLSGACGWFEILTGNVRFYIEEISP